MKRKIKRMMKNIALTTLTFSIMIGTMVAFGEDETPYHRIITHASEEELHEMEQVLYLECRGESWSGQLATAQVILNRVMSDDYPDTIHDVLSQVDCGYAQYSTYKNRHKAEPGEAQSDVIEFLCNGYMNEFPLSTEYVYQATRRQGIDCVKIDNQWFGRRQ